MDTFFEQNLQRAAIQVMETILIIGTSKNLETIKSRYSFLCDNFQGRSLSAIDTLRSAQNNSQYSMVIQSAIDQYKTVHTALAPQDFQLAILSNPTGFNLTEFYCISLVNAMKRLCAAQGEEISTLKKETAKKKRITKVIETIGCAKNELEEHCSMATSYSSALNQLENMATTFNANE